MIVHTCRVRLQTKGFFDCIDITAHLGRCLDHSKVKDGLLTVINPGSTGAITTIECESGAINDLRRAIERLAPTDGEYEHNLRWGDGNGFSHVRSALMKPSLTIPVVAGSLCLGTWQQVVFLDFDNRPRNRTLVVQLIGKATPSEEIHELP
ncbi:MAG: secondary thiamine-phosphate synthase enzyme YjbQ [Thermodesulfobacteriota bacterium]